MIKAIVITGDGLNCERETARALKMAGAAADIFHINELIKSPNVLSNYQIMAIPGGFSFGDEISSGQILALKIKHGLSEAIDQFVKDKKLIIGICNGFQTLAKLGLLPAPNDKRSMTLHYNDQKSFIDKWVELNIPKSNCIWTENLSDKIDLPVRHGEGKVVFAGDEGQQSETFKHLQNNGQIALYYTENINGSYEKIAGICDPTGRIFGLMPHPEAAVDKILRPTGKKQTGIDIGQLIFNNGVKYAAKYFDH